MAGTLQIKPRNPNGVLYILGTYKGERIRLSTKTHDIELARKIKARIEKQIDRSLMEGGKPVFTFGQAAQRYIESTGDVAPSSFYYVSLFQKLWLNKPIHEIQPQDALAYAQKRRADGSADSTIAREIRQAQAVLNFALRMDWIDKPIKLPRPSEDNERCRWEPVEIVDKLVEHARCDNEPIGDLFLFLAHTGARLGEALRTTKNDFLFDEDGRPLAVVFSSQKGRRKRKKTRSVPLNSRAMAVVMKHWPITNNHGLLFPALGANARAWLSNQGRTRIRLCWDRACVAAGLDDFRPHDLRHCFASWAAMKGASDLELMRLLGHAKVEMVRRYAHLNPDILAARVEF